MTNHHVWHIDGMFCVPKSVTVIEVVCQQYEHVHVWTDSSIVIVQLVSSREYVKLSGKTFILVEPWTYPHLSESLLNLPPHFELLSWSHPECVLPLSQNCYNSLSVLTRLLSVPKNLCSSFNKIKVNGSSLYILSSREDEQCSVSMGTPISSQMDSAFLMMSWILMWAEWLQ